MQKVKAVNVAGYLLVVALILVVAACAMVEFVWSRTSGSTLPMAAVILVLAGLGIHALREMVSVGVSRC